jgi:hypothetical protein
MKLTTKEIESRIGTLSNPSKLPCHGYSTPASACPVGSKLRDVPGSICSACYALKGRYGFPNVQSALETRLTGLADPEWPQLIAELISRKEKSGYFRWHDSGDLQDLAHLERIVKVANLLPNIQFWLPTREYATVIQWQRKYGEFPPNLTVRLSALMFDADVPRGVAEGTGLPTSGASPDGYSCPASQTNGKCDTCRACWRQDQPKVTYRKH